MKKFAIVFLILFCSGCLPSGEKYSFGKLSNTFATNSPLPSVEILGQCVVGIHDGYAVIDSCGNKKITGTSYDGESVQTKKIAGTEEKWIVEGNLGVGVGTTDLGLGGRWISHQIRSKVTYLKPIEAPKVQQVISLQAQCANLYAQNQLYITNVVEGCSYTMKATEVDVAKLKGIRVGFEASGYRSIGELDQKNEKLVCKKTRPILIEAKPVKDICINSIYQIADQLVSAYEQIPQLEGEKKQIIEDSRRGRETLVAERDRLSSQLESIKIKLADFEGREAGFENACEALSESDQGLLKTAMKEVAKCEVDRSKIEMLTDQLAQARKEASLTLINSADSLTRCTVSEQQLEVSLNQERESYVNLSKDYETKVGAYNQCMIDSAVSKKELEIYKQNFASKVKPEHKVALHIDEKRIGE